MTISNLGNEMSTEKEISLSYRDLLIFVCLPTSFKHLTF